MPGMALRRESGHMTSSTHQGSRILLTLGLVVPAVATFLTALVLGWFQVSFQLFGEQADRGDYAMAAGIYGTGATMLLLAPAIGYLFRLSALPGLLGLLGAGVLAALSISSADHMSGAEPSFVDDTPWTSGLTLMATIPWNWVLPALLVVGLAIRVRTPERMAPERPGC
jgi:hypothetical protein